MSCQLIPSETYEEIIIYPSVIFVLESEEIETRERIFQMDLVNFEVIIRNTVETAGGVFVSRIIVTRN